MSSRNGRKPRIGVFKFASCDGCQLSLLDLEDELVALAGAVDIAFFPEMSSNMQKGPYDIGLVEGSVTTHHDAARIHEVRKQSKTLVAIGACSTAGGIQALRNWNDSKKWVTQVYAHPEYISTLAMSTPLADHVPIDFELRGCPVNKNQLLELVSATLAGRKPNIPTYSVCIECKRRGNVCIAVTQGVACLGPATQAGCGAICPAFGRGCYGCFGPAESASSTILADSLVSIGHPPEEVVRAFRSFNAWALPNRQASEDGTEMDAADIRKKNTTIKVAYMARVEGEASLLIKLKGDRVQDVKLKIFEPPRLFEALLHGRHVTEAPDITARICGICPIAYQMTSVHAIERALGIKIHPMVRLLRRLLYAGEWIESHVLHIYMLHAPDFLGYRDFVELAKDHPQQATEALRLKKLGNRIMSLLGGREIHPVSVTVGGFYKTPSRADLQPLVEELKWAIDTACAKAEFLGRFEFPDFEQAYEFVALSHPSEYPLNEGRLVSSRGLNIDAGEYEDHFVEQHVKHSNALHSVVRGRGSYQVGPLARFNLNFSKLPDVARQVAERCGLRVPCLNPFKSILARAVETVFALEEALRVVQIYEPPPAPKAAVEMREATGHAITEAPRGINYNRYSFDENGSILSVRIVPPTSQNQKRIEEDLREYVPAIVSQPIEEITRRCEQAVRNYDPCISCATHFLKVKMEQE